MKKKTHSIKKGTYRHFKGGLYEVLYIGTDSETLNKVVIYRALTDGSVWVRPLEMFAGVVGDGKQVPRFEYLGEK